MAKEKSPAFQWYSKDFLSDLAVMGMTMEERGCYITLMSVCWNEDGLPMDATVLRGLCGGIEPSKNVLKKFHEVDGVFQHSRLIKEMKKQKEWSRKQSKRAKDRWSKEKGPKPRQSGGNATVEPTQCSSSSSSSSSSTSTAEKEEDPPTFVEEKAKELSEAYKSIRDEMISEGEKNAIWWIEKFASPVAMMQAIENFREAKKGDDVKYRKMMSSFFNTEGTPVWKEWINKNPQVNSEIPPAQVEDNDRAVANARDPDVQAAAKAEFFRKIEEARPE